MNNSLSLNHHVGFGTSFLFQIEKVPLDRREMPNIRLQHQQPSIDSEVRVYSCSLWKASYSNPHRIFSYQAKTHIRQHCIPAILVSELF